MSNIGSYTSRSFSENQKFLVLDPSTGTTSLVLGSDLVSYITPQLNAVNAESTRLAAENTDYAVGEVIQTTGATTPGDNFAAVYLVVEGGAGDFPMINGNDLLVIRGDEFLREQLIQNTAGVGSDLVAHTGTADTVTEALDKRTIYVGSVAELETLSLAEGVNVYLTESGREGDGVIKSGSHDADPQKGVFIDLANGNYWERSGQGDYLPVEAFGAVGDGVADDEIPIAEAIKFSDRFKIYFSKTYLVGESVSKVPPAGSYLEFGPDAMIVQAANASSTVILVRNRYNKIINPRIRGAKNNPAGNAVVNAHLITVAITDSIGQTEIIGGSLTEAAGDGIYVNGCNGLVVANVVCDDNKRQGMSIVDGENIFGYNSTFSNTSGALPGMGLDIEPNLASDKLKNIVFYKCNFFGNEGVDVSPLYNAEQDEPVSVTLDTCEIGFCRIRQVVGEGVVKINNCTSYSSPGNSLLCQAVSGNIRIEVDGLYSMDAGPGTDSVFDSAISFFNCANINFHGKGITIDETDPSSQKPFRGVGFANTSGSIYIEVNNKLNNDFSLFPRRPIYFSGLDASTLEIDFRYTPNPFIEPPDTFATLNEAQHFAYRNIYDDKASTLTIDLRGLNLETIVPNYWMTIRKDNFGPNDSTVGNLTRIFADNFYPGEFDKLDLGNRGEVVKVRGNPAVSGSLFLEGIQIGRLVQSN